MTDRLLRHHSGSWLPSRRRWRCGRIWAG